MPNRDGTGPRWAQRPASCTPTLEPVAAITEEASTPAAVQPRTGCRGQGGTGRGLGRGRGNQGAGFGCGRRRWSN